MGVAVTVSSKYAMGRTIRVHGTLVFSGNYVTGGDTLAASAFGAPTTKAPLSVDVRGKAGFKYEYDIAGGKVLVRGQEPTNATAGVIAFTQIAAAAYPAGVTGDVISFEAVFPKFG